MSLINDAERGIRVAAELRALKDRVKELELLLDTVREHERREEGSRIRAALLEVCRTKARRYDHAAGYDNAVSVEDLCASLDRIIPEPGQVEGA